MTKPGHGDIGLGFGNKVKDRVRDYGLVIGIELVLGLELWFVHWGSFDVPSFVGPGFDREPSVSRPTNHRPLSSTCYDNGVSAVITTGNNHCKGRRHLRLVDNEEVILSQWTCTCLSVSLSSTIMYRQTEKKQRDKRRARKADRPCS